MYTVQKAANRRSPNYIRKTRNTFCGTRVSVTLPKFCEKLFPHVKFHWNRAIGCSCITKNDFRYGGRPPSWIFKIYLVTWLDSKCAVVYKTLSKSDDFCVEIRRFHDFQDGESRLRVFWRQTNKRTETNRRAAPSRKAAFAVASSGLIKDCARGIVLLKLTADRHDASRDIYLSFSLRLTDSDFLSPTLSHNKGSGCL